VVQGERDLVQDCRSLARFELRGIPPMAAGAARIRVTFHRRCRWPAERQPKEQGSGVEARIDVKPSYGLSDDQIARCCRTVCHRSRSPT
jgi:molecular chaperone HscA